MKIISTFSFSIVIELADGLTHTIPAAPKGVPAPVVVPTETREYSIGGIPVLHAVDTKLVNLPPAVEGEVLLVNNTVLAAAKVAGYTHCISLGLPKTKAADGKPLTYAGLVS
jgi:hypothetical protein